MITRLLLTIIFTVGLLLATSNLAVAVCWYNGETYQTGDVVGDYVCTEDGQWVLK